MREKFTPRFYVSTTVILTGLVLINTLWWHQWLVGLIAGGLYLLFFSQILGGVFIKSKGWQLPLGLLTLLSVIAIVGGGLIYLGIYTLPVRILLLLLIPALSIIPYYANEPRSTFSLRHTLLEHLDTITHRKESKLNLVLIFSYLTLVVVMVILLLSGQTQDAIQSPWQTVSRLFFPTYAIATGALITYLLRTHRTKLPLWLLILHTALTYGVAVMVYRIGYGFDPFIHQATEVIIAKTGGITPTPLYYLGQYGIVLFLHTVSGLTISFLDQILVPILTALTLPLVTFFVFSHWLKKHYALLLSATMLALPGGTFIMTTPQNLANLWFILTILLSMLHLRGELPGYVIWLLTLATIAIHPLAGIPLFITILLLALFKYLHHIYKHSLGLFIATASVFTIALPLALIVNGAVIHLSLPTWRLSEFITITDKFDLGLNIVYFVWFNKVLLALGVIGLACAYLLHHKLFKNNAAYLVAAGVILANYLIVKYCLGFPKLQDFDQPAFVTRILQLSFYVALPLFLMGIFVIIKTLERGNIWFKALLVCGLSASIVVGFFLSYPRVTNYEPAKFFSLSASDLKAVRSIEHTATPKHVVLANQMVGVGAIKEFGFKQYYGDEFFYSMPSGGGVLYQYFLDMTYTGATRETMALAMDYANVNQGYFVLNSYWRNFETILQQASASADAVYSVDNGKLYVFRYDR